MSMFSNFLKKNQINPQKAKKVLKIYDKDKEGNIIIKQGTFIISESPVDSYSFSDSWIFLSQPGVLNREGVSGRMALVKSYIADKCPKFYTGTDAEMSRTNNFILPEIAKQFQLESADYYNVVFEEGDELQSKENFVSIADYSRQKIIPNHRYMLTPSFKGNNEELVHFADILENRNERKASQILSEIVNYLNIRHTPETDLELIKKNFIKQCIFNKYIDFSDEHNLNGGILISRGPEGTRARLAPSYDLDFATGVYNIANGGIQPQVFFRKSDNGGNDLISMLNQFRGNFEKEYLKEIIPRINLQEAIKIGEKYGNFKLSERAQHKYIKFFKAQQKDMVEFYNKAYGEIEINQR